MRRLLMIAIAGMASLALAGTEAQAHGGYTTRGFGIGNHWNGRTSNFYRGGYGSSFYRGGNFYNHYRNPYQSIPRPNPYYGSYRPQWGGGWGGGGWGGGFGCRR